MLVFLLVTVSFNPIIAQNVTHTARNCKRHWLEFKLSLVKQEYINFEVRESVSC